MLYLLLNQLEEWLLQHRMYGYFSVLSQIQFRALAAALLSFVIVLAMGRRVIAALVRLKIGDTGMSDAEALRLHTQSKANTPTMGGVLIVAAILVSLLLLADLLSFYVQLGIVVLVWLAALGAADDWLKLTAKSRGSRSRQGLYSWEKLVFQLGLGVLVGYFTYSHGMGDKSSSLINVINLPLQKTYGTSDGSITGLNPGLWYLTQGAFVAIATLMIAGMSNAVNITDGMDGLASGTSVAVAFGLCVLTLIAGTQSWAQYLLVPYIPGSEELSVLAGAIAGACLGFLWWNCSPAQVFMGDTGSLALGGLIGYVAVVVRQKLVVLLMCVVFLWEIASVVLQVGYFKSTKGKRIFKCAPFHHHLHLSGWTEQQVVARAWIVSVLLVVLALASIKVR